ncbi:MAG: DUF1801 domain-containing protein [Anaerolineae bacterium]
MEALINEQVNQRSVEVDIFMRKLRHPMKKEAVALREIILAADPGISEGIVWRAPSFRTSDYFATLHLSQTDSVQVILHRGSISLPDDPAVEVPDPYRLLRWLAKDRAFIGFRSMLELIVRHEALTALIREWINAVNRDAVPGSAVTANPLTQELATSLTTYYPS